MNDGGFPNGVRWTPVPDLFFSAYLPDRLSPDAVKVFLHLVWRIHRRTAGDPPARRVSDLKADETLRRGMALAAAGHACEADRAQSPDAIESIEGAVKELRDERLVLCARAPGTTGPEEWLFVNTQEGRRALKQWQDGGMVLPDLPGAVARENVERSSVFVLYEENIGVLTPMIAVQLEEAEEAYSAEWLNDAFRIAVEQNARSWAYVKGILDRWAREGREDEADWRRDKTARERDSEGPYSAYIER